MPSARQGLGRLGEAAAAAHLGRAGYRLLAQNWRCAAGELDLVASQGDQMVFVEVRTRRAGSAHGPTPEESVGRTKARRLAALAYAYLDQAGLPADGLWRIDVIVVEVGVDGRIVRLEQIESAVGEA